jgi:hypothetical protein
MIGTDPPDRLAFQPETRSDQRVLWRLYSLVTGTGIGEMRTWWTGDLAEYDLDHQLALGARSTPGTEPAPPGARALLIRCPPAGWRIGCRQ